MIIVAIHQIIFMSVEKSCIQGALLVIKTKGFSKLSSVLSWKIPVSKEVSALTDTSVLCLPFP